MEEKIDSLMAGQQRIEDMLTESSNDPAAVLTNHEITQQMDNSSNGELEARAAVKKWMASYLLLSPMKLFSTSNRAVNPVMAPFVGETGWIDDRRGVLVLRDENLSQKIVNKVATLLNTSKRLRMKKAAETTVNLCSAEFQNDFHEMSKNFEVQFMFRTCYPDEQAHDNAMLAIENDITRNITGAQMKIILLHVVTWYVPMYFLLCHI